MEPTITRIDLVLYERSGEDRCAVRLHTDTGHVGTADESDIGFRHATRITPALLGRDALARERYWSEAKRALRKYDLTGLGVVDLALWDLASSYHESAVHRLLGTYRTRLPAYLSVGVRDSPRDETLPDRFVAAAEDAHRAGYRAFKVRFSRNELRDVDSGTDVDEVALVIDTIDALEGSVGDDMALMLDTTAELETYADALAVGRACDDAGFVWFEDPFKDGGQSQQAASRLREAIDTPVLLTELVTGFESRTDMAVNDGTDFLRVDPAWHGGITGAMKVAHAAEGLGMDVEFHGRGQACRQCMAATRNANFYEINTTLDAYEADLDTVDDDGTVEVSDDPGLGPDPDWATVKTNAILTKQWS